LMILNALEGKALPVYGVGNNVRDWLYVEDHARALHKVISTGQAGETYNIGGRSEMRNIDVVHTLCDLLEELRPWGEGTASEEAGSHRGYRSLITFVQDRPGHDFRYAIDTTKIERE